MLFQTRIYSTLESKMVSNTFFCILIEALDVFTGSANSEFGRTREFRMKENLRPLFSRIKTGWTRINQTKTDCSEKWTEEFGDKIQLKIIHKFFVIIWNWNRFQGQSKENINICCATWLVDENAFCLRQINLLALIFVVRN